jgi:hypothetical protein
VPVQYQLLCYHLHVQNVTVVKQSTEKSLICPTRPSAISKWPEKVWETQCQHVCDYKLLLVAVTRLGDVIHLVVYTYHRSIPGFYTSCHDLDIFRQILGYWAWPLPRAYVSTPRLARKQRTDSFSDITAAKVTRVRKEVRFLSGAKIIKHIYVNIEL